MLQQMNQSQRESIADIVGTFYAGYRDRDAVRSGSRAVSDADAIESSIWFTDCVELQWSRAVSDANAAAVEARRRAGKALQRSRAVSDADASIAKAVREASK